jgi:glycosyltransferase involved in cell wall biosynthesis
MASYEPRADLFERQIRSIRAQTDTSWHCIVSDDGSSDRGVETIERVLGGDPRFELHRHDDRLGHYFSFERALELVPPGTPYVALADQDDEWAPDKVARLKAALERDAAVLAYSDQRIVTASGEVLSPTAWQERTNQCDDLLDLVVSNMVTGAASMFRGWVLDTALPLPPKLPNSYHDHWLAIVARSHGRVTYVDRPLSDYVQHEDQVVGHPAGRARTMTWRSGKLGDVRRAIRRAEDSYYNLVLLQRVHAMTALLRSGERLAPTHRRVLEHLAHAPSLGGFVVMTWRALRESSAVTLGYHRDSLRGMLWERALRLRLARRPSIEPQRGAHPPASLITYRRRPRAST